jgi:hypothetical protein
VQRYFRQAGGAAAIAILTAVALTGAPQAATPQAAAPAAPKEKTVKDQAEYDISNQTFKDITEKNWKQALTDLDTWKQKYPDSDWKDDREFYYLQGLFYTQQFDKAEQFGGELMDKDLASMFKANQGNILAIDYMVTASAAQLLGHNATREQIALGDKAAHKLLEFADTYFVAANKPSGQTDEQFQQTKAQMTPIATGYLLQEAVQPGVDAMAKKDCPAAEAAFTKALGDYPQNTWISYQLARAYNCQQKVFPAVYEYARAAAVDPSLLKSTDPNQVTTFVKKTYVTVHGSDEGYDALLALAKTAPLPPADFKIITVEELKAKADEDFAKNNPELAVWKNIKDNLVAQGEPFFDNMKGAELPQLLGVIADAKPACHSKSLTVYVPSPDNAAKTPEITIKFATALSGKPEVGSQIKFVGVGDTFAANPFMVTLTAEKDKIQDLKMTPCVVPGGKKSVPKK